MKNLLAGILCLCLLWCAAPASAAEEETNAAPVPWDGKTIDVSWYNEKDTEFYLETPAQLMGLAAIVNGIYNSGITEVIGGPSCIVDLVSDGGISGSNNLSTDTYHYGADDFNGKTVYLAADLDMGGVCDPETGVWSGPLYMPIGGQYLMEENDASTKLGSSFCGTLDGQGHYILNIYCARRCTTGNYGDGSSIGVIGRLGVHDNDPVEIRPETPAVRNLAITGYIEGNRSIGGFAGKIGKTLEGAVIENCANYATVKNTDAKGCGGIVGASWNGGVIQNCFNAGAVLTTYVCPTGGIAGSNEITIKNCYSVGQISALRDSYAMGIGTNNGGGVNVDNCFWLEGSAPGGGYYGKTAGTVTELTADEMKTASLASQLGEAYTVDTEDKNGGFPILLWQAENDTQPLDPPPAPKPVMVLSDVADTEWYYDAVTYVMEEELFDLTEEETLTFSPDEPMTRLMLAEALYRLAGSPAAQEKSRFPDCGETSVAWASEEGVVLGMEDGRFAPDDSITREQIVVMLMRYVSLTAETDTRGDLSIFPDRDSIEDWAEDAVSWAVGEGLIKGTETGLFLPQGTATRAEVAQILLNFSS